MGRRTTVPSGRRLPAAPPSSSRGRRVPPAPRPRSRGARSPWALAAALLVLLGLGGLFLIYQSANQTTAAGTTPRSDYQVGTPGPGAVAPSFTLPSTGGGSVSLADYRGKTVLLYFHEGLGCQPCWDQMRDLEKASGELKAAGVDAVLAITNGPVNLIAQKVRDDRLSTVSLADTDLAVSRAYTTNKYGMMGEGRNGHSFLLVAPDGSIRWRADYGGAPNYTMYVPVPRLLADIRAGAPS